MITVSDIRKAIKGMPGDAEVSLDMADPPDGSDYRIDGVGNYGGTLQISVSDHPFDDDDDDDDLEEDEETGIMMPADQIAHDDDEED